MSRTKAFAIIASWAAIALPGLAQAAQAPGSAEATVVEPNIIVNGDDLRFGRFIRPTAAGSLRVNVDGSSSATGGMTTTYNITQTGTGRGPATFHLYGEPNRFILPLLPNSTTISNGSNSMTVNNFTDNVPAIILRLDPTGYFRLTLGATLSVGANQALGTYTGTYNVTVFYF